MKSEFLSNHGFESFLKSFFTLWRRRPENFALMCLSTLAKRNFEVQNQVKLSPEAENMVGKDLRALRTGGENRWGKFFGLQKLVGNSPPFPTCRWGKYNTAAERIKNAPNLKMAIGRLSRDPGQAFVRSQTGEIGPDG